MGRALSNAAAFGGRPRPGIGSFQRPFTRTAIAGLGAHVFFELSCGVGMPFASLLGPRRAAAFWAGAMPLAWHASAGKSCAHQRFAGLANGLGLAAVAGHFCAWPTRRAATGLPWLIDCEGLGPERMPVYNVLLYVSGATAATGLAFESGRSWRLGTALALGLFPLLMVGQRWEFRRLQRRAHAQPGWWNRGLR
jgi:hypothetical protein